jgi:monoamine oxidase
VVRGLVRDSAEAARLGIDGDEVVARRLSRQELLRDAGKLGLAVSVVPAFLAACGGKKRSGSEVAIVGAGIAGLTAALTLHDHGVRSTVYEANPDRVGGRLHSFRDGYWDYGQVTEWCGELIDTDMKVTRRLARRFELDLLDLDTFDRPASTDTYRFFGSYYPFREAVRDFQPVLRAIKRDLRAAGPESNYRRHTPGGVALDKMSAYDWIQTRVPGGHDSPFGALLDVAYNQELAAETTDLSALYMLDELGFGQKPGKFEIYGESDERFHITGGNEQLPEAIAGALPDGTVEKGWRMTAIGKTSGGSVRLVFDVDGKTKEVTADHVILALPFAVLRTLDYGQAGFDRLKLKTIQDLGAGHNTKFLLQFKSRPWEKRGPWGLSDGTSYSNAGYMTTWDTTRGQKGTAGILVNYTGGNIAESFRVSSPYSTADDDSALERYATRFLQEFGPTFPGADKLWNGKATLSTPFTDPNLLLSYSYIRPGQFTTINGYEHVPQGNIHFAGEHCSPEFRGFIEGGAATGVQAAREILAAL